MAAACRNQKRHSEWEANRKHLKKEQKELVEVIVLTIKEEEITDDPDDVTEDEIKNALEATGCDVRLIQTSGGWFSAARSAFWVSREVGPAQLIVCIGHPLALIIFRCLAAPRLVYIQRSNELNNPLWSRFFHQVLLRLADDVIVHSRKNANKYQSMFCNCKAPKIIYPSIDIWPIQTEEPQSILKIIPNLTKFTNVFVSYGHFLPETNFELVIDAFEMMYNKLKKKPWNDKIRLVILGDLQSKNIAQKLYYRQINKYASEKSSCYEIIVLKKLSPCRRRTLFSYSLCIIFANTKTRFVLEALFAGRAIIAVGTEANKELVPKRVGLRVLPNIRELSKALMALQVDIRLAEEMGRNAKEYYSEHFAYQKFTNKLKNLISGNFIQCHSCLEFYETKKFSGYFSEVNPSCSNCTQLE